MLTLIMDRVSRFDFALQAVPVVLEGDEVISALVTSGDINLITK